LFAGIEEDVLYGDAGSDRLEANRGNDRVFGGVGNDELYGGEGDDNLIGGEGNDLITGLSGNDTLTGDTGSDRFMLSIQGTDIITDFTTGEDSLELPKNISFSDLEIVRGQGDNAADTFITFDSETLAILNNTNATEIG
jgi:Ca2+-binding RTX toxin-like protein